MFCPLCGKEAKRGLCFECYFSRKPIEVEDFRVTKCSICGKFFYESWNQEVDLLQVRRKIKPPEEIHISKSNIEVEEKEKYLKFFITVFGEYQGEKIEKKIEKDALITKKLCIECGRKTGGYFEAVLQFRGTNLNIGQIRLDPNFVSKIDRLREGVDVKVTSRDYARKVSNDYVEKGFQIKRSKELGGVVDGNTVYRTYYSIRAQELKKGDFVFHKNKIYRIVSAEKILVCRDMTGKEKTIAAKNVEVAAKSEDMRKAVITFKNPEKAQIMDLSDYKNYDAENPETKLGPGDEVNYIKIKEKIYILP